MNNTNTQTEASAVKVTRNYIPRTGISCGCRRGIERDNCPNCEGTGRAIDWSAYWQEKHKTEVTK